MHAARRELQEIRRVPQHALVSGKLNRQPTQTLLELSDVGLPRLQMHATGLEQRPAVGLRTHREQGHKARFPAARLTDDEHRTRRLMKHTHLTSCEDFANGVVLDEQRTIGVVFDEAAKRLQVLTIQRRAPEGGDPLEQLPRRGVVDLPEQTLCDIYLCRSGARETVAK